MRNLNLLRYSLIGLCLLFVTLSSNAGIQPNTTPSNMETVIQQKGKKKLSLKERWAMKKLKRMQKKQAKNPQDTQLFSGSLSKIILGIILVLIGAIAILSSIVSLSIGGLLLSIALILVGAVVIAWGALDIVL